MKKCIFGSINHNTKTLYIVNHKAANTTILNVLKKYGYEDRKTMSLDITDLNYIFTFVRNPYDRLLSRYIHMKYYFLQEKDRPKTLNLGPAVLPSLKEYFKYHNLKFREDNFIFSKFVEFTEDNFDVHWEPQTNKFISAVASLDKIDFIGKFENLQQDFNTVCDKIGIPRQKLPHKNQSQHKHYTEYYDEETREIVAKKYARDIEYFGYKFGE
jgi:hypothetical protein